MSASTEYTRRTVFFSISTLYGYISEAAEQYCGTYPCQPGGGM